MRQLFFLLLSLLPAVSVTAQTVTERAPVLPYEVEHPYWYENYIPDTSGPHLETGVYFNQASPDALWRHYMGREISVRPQPFIARSHIDSIVLREEMGELTPGYGVVVYLNAQGAKALKAGSRKALGQNVVVVLANRVMLVPKIASVISSGKLWLPLREDNRPFVEGLVEEIKREAPTEK